jgi:hypothetical protein
MSENPERTAVTEPQQHDRPDGLQRTEKARRAARYRSAERRVEKIVSGRPQLTQEQRSTLAALLVAPPAQDTE